MSNTTVVIPPLWNTKWYYLAISYFSAVAIRNIWATCLVRIESYSQRVMQYWVLWLKKMKKFLQICLDIYNLNEVCWKGQPYQFSILYFWLGSKISELLDPLVSFDYKATGDLIILKIYDPYLKYRYSSEIVVFQSRLSLSFKY